MTHLRDSSGLSSFCHDSQQLRGSPIRSSLKVTGDPTRRYRCRRRIFISHVKELQNLVEELRTNAIEKDTHLDHLQKRNDELSTPLEKVKGDAVADFKASNLFTNLMDTNYAASFEDFRLDAMENFPEIDFSSIKLNLGGAAISSPL
ncbi:hypothetical protein SO802_014489 [Lithocarpus litseifolius]|uniref:Uncharacterized protein n=1 Tax=Lithocarpus litseifolius TaxID=425828 RepID=A0AAW2CR39_9ROSI